MHVGTDGVPIFFSFFPSACFLLWGAIEYFISSIYFILVYPFGTSNFQACMHGHKEENVYPVHAAQMPSDVPRDRRNYNAIDVWAHNGTSDAYAFTSLVLHHMHRSSTGLVTLR
jgi:hypothetical protein